MTTTAKVDLPRPDYSAMQGFVSGMFRTLGAPTPTKPCTCGGVMEYGPATSDNSGPGGREVQIKAGWACADCWRVEPEEKPTPDRPDE